MGKYLPQEGYTESADVIRRKKWYCKRKEENVKIKGGKTKGKGQSEVQRVK